MKTKLSLQKFYDIVIKLIANIADIEVLKNAEADGLWSSVHEWDKLISLVDGILDMVGVKSILLYLTATM